jgi:hypothetical protein
MITFNTPSPGSVSRQLCFSLSAFGGAASTARRSSQFLPESPRMSCRSYVVGVMISANVSVMCWTDSDRFGGF